MSEARTGTQSKKGFPRVVAQGEWLVQRKKLLTKEKRLTRARDALNSERRRLLMVKVEKDYLFEGAGGKASLLDLFDSRRQLIVYHFMFNPDWEDGCPSCTAWADERSEGQLAHLHARETTLVLVSRAPLAKLEAYKAKKGWNIPWFSSYGSDFNYDYQVTMDASVAPVVYNYRSKAEHEKRGTGYYFEGKEPIEEPGLSCFLCDGGDVYHTYSMYGRGGETIGGSYYFLDLTALGRQEEWEEPKGRAAAASQARPDFKK